MDAQRWRQIDELFHTALAEPSGRRAVLLEHACGGDAALRSEIEALLSTHDRGSSVFDSPAFDIAPRERPEEVSTVTPGQRIGRYTLRGVIGRGGSGIVYEAQQDDPARIVALKVVRALAYADELTPRLFRREGQALARLEHPGIATIHEAGSDNGCYYFAMECVDGVPLTASATDQRLSIRQRLELFKRVCDAVHYAHQRGVIHRDLKPSNILVMSDGQPKVLDFGLARITDPEGQHSQITESGAFHGTLAYASPEQVRGPARPGSSIDVRSDVYSLGVILYEMLAGARPDDTGGLSLPQAARVICEQLPRPPASISPALRGELGTIILKALEKEPDRRYSSAAALGEDIERYLNDEPILAHPPSAAYLFRKLVQRHRALAAGVLIGMLCLVGGGTAATIMWLRAQAAADLATREKADKEFINEFLFDAFRSAAPEETGRALTVRQLLDKAAARLAAQPPANPLVLANLHVFVGDAYQSLELSASARPNFERAVELRRARLGADHAETLDARRRALRSLALEGRQRDGADQLRELLSRCRQVLGTQHPVTIATLINWVAVEPMPPPAPNPARMRARAERNHEFVELAHGVLRYYESRLGPDHEDTLVAKRTLALLYVIQDDAEEALRLTREIVAQLRPGAASDPRKRAALADALASLSRQLVSLRRIDKADAAIQEALTIDIELHGESHGRTLSHRGARLEVLHFQGLDAQEESETRAVAAETRAFYGPHPQSVLAAIRLGQFLLQQRRPDEARAAFADADEMCRIVDGPLSEGRMRVFTASLGRVEPEELAAAIIADAQRTVREGAATEAETLRFFLTSLSDQRRWAAALELVRRIVGRPPPIPNLPVEQTAEILADVVESSNAGPDPRDGAPFRAAMLELVLGCLDRNTPLRPRLTQLAERCRAERESRDDREQDFDPPGPANRSPRPGDADE